MKKIVIFLLLLCLFFNTITPVSSTKAYQGENEVKAKIKFNNVAVTTRNLKEKLLHLSYSLKFVSIKNQLNYMDETFDRKSKDLHFFNCRQLEHDYQILLANFGMHEEIEKIEKNGVLLSSVVIVIKEKDLNLLAKMGYQISIV